MWWVAAPADADAAGRGMRSVGSRRGLAILRLLRKRMLPNRCSCPSVRAVNRWNLLHVQLLGDLLQRHPLAKHHVDLHPPSVVTSVADPMREPDVVGGEATSVRPEYARFCTIHATALGPVLGEPPLSTSHRASRLHPTPSRGARTGRAPPRPSPGRARGGACPGPPGSPPAPARPRGCRARPRKRPPCGRRRRGAAARARPSRGECPG